MDDFYIVITQKINKNNKSGYKLSTTFLEKLCVENCYIALHSFSINVQPNQFVGYFALGFPRTYSELTKYKVFKIVCDNNPKSVIDAITNVVNKMYKDHTDIADEKAKNIQYFADTRTTVHGKPHIYFEDRTDDVEYSHVMLGSGFGVGELNAEKNELPAPFHIKLLGNTATMLGFEDKEKIDIELVKDLIEKERPGTPFEDDDTARHSVPLHKSKVKISKKITRKANDNFCYVYCKLGKLTNLLNSEKCNLLGVYKLNQENKNTTVEIINEIFVPVNSSEISTLELELFDSNKNKIILDEGLAVFVLHLKRFYTK